MVAIIISNALERPTLGKKELDVFDWPLACGLLVVSVGTRVVANYSNYLGKDQPLHRSDRLREADFSFWH